MMSASGGNKNENENKTLKEQLAKDRMVIRMLRDRQGKSIK
jgi:hypothetical protein